MATATRKRSRAYKVKPQPAVGIERMVFARDKKPYSGVGVIELVKVLETAEEAQQFIAGWNACAGWESGEDTVLIDGIDAAQIVQDDEDDADDQEDLDAA